MSGSVRRVRAIATELRHRLRSARHDDVGAGEIVTIVIVAAGMAALAISVVAAISLLVNNKVAGISL